ncbi:MAG: PH domain-containing protein, partial [Alphaproteobacteria bacterium]|nr:PH domain-containing protein [Alphaproteobacteria bacterium]
MPILILSVGLFTLFLPFIAPKLIGAEHATAQAATGAWASFTAKIGDFFSFLGSFLPDSVVTALSSANEIRLILTGSLFTLLGTVYLLVAIIKKVSTEQVITNKKIIFKKGFITVDENEISLYNVEGVKVFQTVLDRMLNRGDVLVNGIGMEQIEIRKIHDPNRFRHHAYTAVEKYSGRHGGHAHHAPPPPTPPQSGYG